MQEDDLVRLANRREPVRQKDQRAILRQPGIRVIEQRLRVFVEPLGGLFDDQDRRVADQGASEAQQERLPGVERFAMLF